MTGCFQGGAVVQCLASRDKYDAIREVIQKAPVFSVVDDKKKVEDAVIQREQILSTGLGRGVALAHGTTPSVDRILIALGISEQGINFDSIDRAPVHLLFVITNPPHSKMEYLIALAAVTRLIRDETFRQSLYKKISTLELEKILFDAYHACLQNYASTAGKMTAGRMTAGQAQIPLGMLIIPAIDLLNGECVRLNQGSYDSAQSYSQNPVEIARRFEEAGARMIHLVDLDAARGREQANRSIIRQIRQAVKVTLEVGGGIRRSDDIKTFLDMGINRLVLGTVLARNPDQAAQWCDEFGKVFMGGIDALAGQVRVSGWQEGSMMEDVDLARRAGQMGLVGLIYTNITRDGTLRGPDITQTNLIAEVSGLPVILSGGISSNDDVAAVCREKHAKVAGVLIGKALYEKRVDLKSLVDTFQAKK